jgi:aryl-alcohol dehydrogenase-like predicted oxidoreductase
MRYKQLGRTGLFVSEITLGTMTFGDSGGDWSKIAGLQQQQADELVRGAIDAGINLIDTADVYSAGQSESLLGQSLRNLGVKRSDILIATKGYILVGTGPNDRGASRAHILDAVAASLKRLQLDYIDLYQIHGNDPVTPVDETLRVLDDLVGRGLVRYVGVSNWPAWKVAKALGISERNAWTRIDSLQSYYSIAGRDIERDIVPLLNEERVGLMVWSPLAGGLLSGKFGPDASPEGTRRASFDFPPVNKERAWACVAAMRDIAKNHGVSVARVALAWILAKPHVTTVLVGAKSLEQLKDNIAATELALSADEIAALDAVSALPPEYPGWMIERQASYRRPQPAKTK